MLVDLPLELIINITARLPIRDKIQLMASCQKLSNDISKTCLFDSLDLRDNGDMGLGEIESTLLYFEDHKEQARQVKLLYLDHVGKHDQLIGALPTIFPNVNWLSGRFPTNPLQRHCHAYANYVKWKDTIQNATFTPDNSQGIFSSLLKKHTFSRLTHLEVDAVAYYVEKVKKDEILLCLKNVPALKWLKLCNYPFRLEDLEVLHSSCLLLATIKMKNCVIVIEQDESLPAEMMAATTVTQLFIKNMMTIDSQGLFLTYLTRKYTNLINFDFYPTFSDGWIKRLFPNQTKEELSSNPKYIKRIQQLNTTKNEYAALGFPALPGSLKSLNLMLRHLKDPLDMMLTEKCHKLKYIGFHTGYHPDDRTLDVQKLLWFVNSMPSLQTLWVAFNTSAKNHHVQHVSNNITVLRTFIQKQPNDNDMDLGWLLSMFPSLHELKIKSAGARLVINDSNPRKTYPNLVKLTIRHSKTHPNLLEDIRACAPNLKHLSWSLVDWVTKEDAQSRSFESGIINCRSVYSIYLNGFSLDIFDLEFNQLEGPHKNTNRFFLELNTRNYHAEFVISRGSISVVDYNSYPEEDEDEKLEAMPTVIINCDNVKMIKINSIISIDVAGSKIQMEF